MSLKNKFNELFKTKEEKWKEKLLKDYYEGKVLKVGGELFNKNE